MAIFSIYLRKKTGFRLHIFANIIISNLKVTSDNGQLYLFLTTANRKNDTAVDEQTLKVITRTYAMQ